MRGDKVLDPVARGMKHFAQVHEKRKMVSEAPCSCAEPVNSQQLGYLCPKGKHAHRQHSKDALLSKPHLVFSHGAPELIFSLVLSHLH